MCAALGTPPGKSKAYILLLPNAADTRSYLRGNGNDTGCCAFSSLLPVASRALQAEVRAKILAVIG
jgi:hypothetical protein